LKGVTPNIIIPDQYETLKYREKDNPDALQWDEIQRAYYTRSTPSYDLDLVKRKSESRINTNSTFNAIKDVSLLMEKSNEKVYSLQLEKYRAEQKKIREAFKKIDETNKQQKALDVKMMEYDTKRLSQDSDKLERRKQWITNLSKDIYIKETSNVITDMISQGLLVKGN
jgi:carboxyl-terminal processing protease